MKSERTHGLFPLFTYLMETSERPDVDTVARKFFIFRSG